MENAGVTEITTATDSGLSGGGAGIVTLVADVRREVLDSAVAGIPYTGGSGDQSIPHTLGEKYISVICFNSDVVVTSVTVTMVSTVEFTINSASDIDKILVIG